MESEKIKERIIALSEQSMLRKQRLDQYSDLIKQETEMIARIKGGIEELNRLLVLDKKEEKPLEQEKTV